eukprot:4719411-Amphidinium_carterae.1
MKVEGGRASSRSITCQFCQKRSTMFSCFIYVDSRRDEALAAKGEYPFTWHPAKIHDEAFQAALNLQRGREMEESTRRVEGVVNALQGTPEARSVALMCFMCAEDWLRDYRIRGGGSFITKGERERQLKRWTQWNIDKQAVKKIDPEVMSKLSIEHAGGEDW